MSKTQAHSNYVYDVHIYDPELSWYHLQIEISKLCKKWCFQRELEVKTKQEYYKLRCSLKEEVRETVAIKIFKSIWSKVKVSVTSKENRDIMFYVMDEDNKVVGPWTEKSILPPLDVLGMVELYPWQKQMRDYLKQYDENIIDIVYNTEGNIGKTAFVRWMIFNTDSAIIPYPVSYSNIMRIAYLIGPKMVYLFDMPRAMQHSDDSRLYKAMEKLKPGYSYDYKHKTRELYFNPPRICLFTVKKPNENIISNDKFKIWTIKKNNIVPWKPEAVIKKSFALTILNSHLDALEELDSKKGFNRL